MASWKFKSFELLTELLWLISFFMIFESLKIVWIIHTIEIYLCNVQETGIKKNKKTNFTLLLRYKSFKRPQQLNFLFKSNAHIVAHNG